MSFHTSLRRHNNRISHRQVIHAPDRIGIIGFNDRAFIIALPAEAHAHWLQERSQRLHERVGGMTNMTAGLRAGVEMCERTPRSILRRIWLLSDGEPNVDTAGLWPMVERACTSFININTIGFGDQYNESLLRKIAAATHRGKFVPVSSLRELTATLVGYTDAAATGARYQHRAECTVLVIDLSSSMTDPMQGKTKVQVVEKAILQLLLYKQRLFS